MSIAAVVGVGVIAAAMSLILRKYHPEYSMLISICTGAIILLLIVIQVRPAVSQMTGLIAQAGMPNEYSSVLLKALGVCFLTQLACDSCRDVGETALASKIELAGKVSLLILALPLFQNVAGLAISLING